MCIGFFIDLNICMNENNQQLSISDLAVIKNLVEVACSRGAFRAAEMKSVGEVYEKLTGFLQTVIAQAEEQASSTVPQQGETK